MKHVIVVGGGASGLVAAISAAREGARVTLIEQKDRVGKKILSTGNGRCNLTNLYMESTCFRGDNLEIVSEVLKQFGHEKTMDFFEELGVVLKERQGYVYPTTDQATTILDVLRMETDRLGISLVLGQCVEDIWKKNKCFCVRTNYETYRCDAVILSTGGKAAPVLGSDGSGYTLAKKLGHKLTPVVPALVQLKGKEKIFKQIAGVRMQAKVSLYVEDALISSDIGELQWTNYGISGIPVFQVSRFAAKGLYENQKVVAELDFMPGMTDCEFEQFIKERKEKQGYKTVESFLIGVFHKKMIGLLLKKACVICSGVASELSEKDVQKLVSLCKHFRVEIEETMGFEHAQVCAGGVKTIEINQSTMESLCESGLYITGELLDIDGICGGYNLQWAWATGYLAGKNAAKGQ